MARVFVDESSLVDIADAIREKNGSDDTYKPSQMGDAVRSIQSGGGVNWLDYAISMQEMFHSVDFKEPTDLNVHLGKNVDALIVDKCLYCAFRQSKNLRSIVLSCDEYQRRTINGFGAFNSCSSVEYVDLSNFSTQFSNTQYLFYLCQNLKTILGELDFSAATVTSGEFTNCKALEDVTFKPNTLKKSISFANSSLLSNESIQSIIDGLATVETAQTLTFHADVKAKLTEEQIATITSKNWTLA